MCAGLAKYRDIEIHGLGITEVPRSGLPEELLEKYGISAAKIAEKVKALLAP